MAEYCDTPQSKERRYSSVPNAKRYAEPLGWGTGSDRNIDSVMEVVKPETYRKWFRQKKEKMPFKRSGRPRIVCDGFANS
jgi:hypothetical protein